MFYCTHMVPILIQCHYTNRLPILLVYIRNNLLGCGKTLRIKQFLCKLFKCQYYVTFIKNKAC